MAQFVDRDRRLMAVRDGPDNVLRPERRIPAEEHVGQGRLHRLRIDRGHAPAIELDADVALDPFSASPSPTVVVVLPSPAGVGVIAVTRTSFAFGRTLRPSRYSSDTFALKCP